MEAGTRFRLSDKILAKWDIIGETLGLDHDTIEAINDDERRAEKKLRRVLSKWFDNAGALPNHQDYPLTWDGLRTLLVDIQKKEVAEQFFEFLSTCPNTEPED